MKKSFFYFLDSLFSPFCHSSPSPFILIDSYPAPYPSKFDPVKDKINFPNIVIFLGGGRKRRGIAQGFQKYHLNWNQMTFGYMHFGLKIRAICTKTKKRNSSEEKKYKKSSFLRFHQNKKNRNSNFNHFQQLLFLFSPSDEIHFFWPFFIIVINVLCKTTSFKTHSRSKFWLLLVLG